MNVRRLEALNSNPSPEPIPIPIDNNTQEKEINYILLYTGSKFFWRSRLTFEINIYLHKDQDILEIISFNSESFIENNRIYLNLTTLLNVAGKGAIDAKMEVLYVAKLAQDPTLLSRPEQSYESRYEEAKNALASSFTLARLQNNENDTEKKGLIYAPSPWL